MITVNEASEAETQSWLEDWRTRLEAWYTTRSDEPEWVSHSVEQRLSRSKPQLFKVDDLASVTCLVAMTELTQGPPTVMLDDIWVDPAHRGKGLGRAALEWAKTWAADRAGRMMATTQEVFFHEFVTRAVHMIKPLSREVVGATGRPITPEEFVPWRQQQLIGYADDIINSGLMTPEDARARANEQFDQLLPDGVGTAGHTFLAVEVDGEVVATNWLGHAYAPKTSWVYGVEVSEGHRGKGYGRVAMLVGEQAALDAGDTQLGLNVFGHNSVARRLYDSMAYRTVETHRSIGLGA